MESAWKVVMPDLIDLVRKLNSDEKGGLAVRGLLSDLARLYEIHGPEAAEAFVVGKREDELYEERLQDLTILVQVVHLVSKLPTRAEGRYVLAKLEAIRNYYSEEVSDHA
ncbi:MAG: hypothetical protein IMX00_00875 [Limnochordales bacterium]|nr:hypothetical protein [Limnochordales bacterium]